MWNRHLRFYYPTSALQELSKKVADGNIVLQEEVAGFLREPQ